jgi:hypothetical protein
MHTLWQDLRYGARMLLKSKMFTLVAVLSLALGIGANTAIFSLLDAVLFRLLPVQEPEKLALIGSGEWGAGLNEFPNRSWGRFSYPFYREARRLNNVFSDVAAIHTRSWDAITLPTLTKSGSYSSSEITFRPETLSKCFRLCAISGTL